MDFMKRLLIAPLLLAMSSPALADYYTNKLDPMTDERVINVVLYSREAPRIALQVTCNGGNVYAGLRTDSVLDSRDVTVRWDNEKPIEYFWNKSKDLTYFYMGFNGYTGRKQANRYVKEFREHSSMLVRFGTYMDGTKTVRFDLEKMHPRLDRAESEGCAF